MVYERWDTWGKGLLHRPDKDGEVKHPRVEEIPGERGSVRALGHGGVRTSVIMKGGGAVMGLGVRL